ncbi:zinc ribbon domain-containing protein [Corallococcus sp. AB049A]|uniref:zinc ribbon domain-containing protein n=1 Tax=Corallococcus sp. AB049A TaxID=2316721 RepID=UPI000EA32AC2|nr:zinc ribbon domain-containing protein [Corallococcus sp. AB049A]RKH45505.1 zinc ribbon domain-containing protein [Corallococcus sp. AB050B]RKI73119.1 zinc ribbon domain-containing protein [Corallococcus sp. AB049A]
MTPSCPSCQAPFAPGAETCARCGASLLVAPAPGGAEPVCAVHPEWRSVATCQRCGAFACARCLRQGPEGAICATCHEREPLGQLPWDQREELGTLKAFWRTCFGMLMRPTETLKGVNPDASVGSSMGFVLLSAIAGFLSTCLLYIVIFAVVLGFMPDREMRANEQDVKLWMTVGMGVVTLLTPLFVTGMTLVNAAVDHLILRMGGVERGFSVTMRAHALSHAPYIVGVIPFVAVYAAPFWAMGLRVFTYRTLHRTSWGTAAAGALIAPLLSCCLCGGAYGAIMFATLKSTGQF